MDWKPKIIKGLEAFYDPDKVFDWNPTIERPTIRPDPWGGHLGFTFCGSFDGAADFAALEALYKVVYEAAEAAKARGQKDFYCAETGTADGLSTCFIARALEDAGIGHVWTAEICLLRSTETPRPWPKLWKDMDLVHRITACHGDTRDINTWTDRHVIGSAEQPFPERIDFAFIDSMHDAETPYSEVELFKSYFSSNAVIAFHDTSIDIFDGVRKAVERISDDFGVL